MERHYFTVINTLVLNWTTRCLVATEGTSPDQVYFQVGKGGIIGKQ